MISALATRRLLIGVGSSALQSAAVRTQNPKMSIKTEAGAVILIVPFAPAAVTHDGFAANYQADSRPGRKPLFSQQGLNLRTMSMTIYIASRDMQASAEASLTALTSVVNTGARLVVSYGPMESGLWNLTGMVVTSETRSATTNEITRATVDLQFTEVSNYIVNVGPITGGVQPPGGTLPSNGKSSSVAGTSTYYVVKKGDTLYAIAVAFYKDGSKWPQIADANGIRNPSLLSIGQKLLIPSATQIAAVVQSKSQASGYTNPISGVYRVDKFGNYAVPAWSPDAVTIPGGKTRVVAQ
jgi:nucleoid-associated protein YgaU